MASVPYCAPKHTKHTAPSFIQQTTLAAVPLKEAGSTIDVEISMSITTPGPLGKPDKFTVTNLSDGKPYAGGIHIKGMRMSTALALEDGHGKELAQSSNREE